MNHATSTHDPVPPGFWGSRFSMGLLVLGGIATYFLLSEHRAHFFGALPFLLLLACPLMHVFMHKSHGVHGGHRDGHAGRDGANADAHPAPAQQPASTTGAQP